jgi:hypothetical protein
MSDTFPPMPQNVVVVYSKGRYGGTQRSEKMDYHSALALAEKLREKGWTYVRLDLGTYR